MLKELSPIWECFPIFLLGHHLLLKNKVLTLICSFVEEARRPNSLCQWIEMIIFMQSRRCLCFFLVFVLYIVFPPSGFPSHSKLSIYLKKYYLRKSTITLNSLFQRFFFLCSHLNMNKQKRKSQGKLSMAWMPEVSCELSLSLGRKGLYAHRGSMSHGSCKKSANLWEFTAKFFLFWFALRALLLSIAQLWPVLLFLS